MLTVNSDIYDKTHSLKQTVEILSDRKNEITDDAILNLVTKYFYAYFYPESTDQLVDLRAIDILRKQCDDYFLLKENYKQGDVIAILNNPICTFFYNHEYPLTMLYDLARTTAVVTDIIQRKLSAVLQSDRYV